MQNSFAMSDPEKLCHIEIGFSLEMSHVTETENYDEILPTVVVEQKSSKDVVGVFHIHVT